MKRKHHMLTALRLIYYVLGLPACDLPPMVERHGMRWRWPA